MSLVDQKRSFDQMVAQGMPVQEAYRRAFPNGLTQEQIQKSQASAEEKAGLAQVAGMIAGTVGATAGYDAIAAALATKAATAGTVGATTAGATTAGTVGATTGATTAGTIGATTAGSVGGAGVTGLGTTTATTPGLGTSAMALASNPATLAALALAANAYMYNKNRQKYKAMSAGEGFRTAAKDPMSYLFGAGGLLGAAFGNKDRYLTEDIRLRKLQGEGYNIPESALTQLEHGRSMEELMKLEQDKQARGEFGNTKFAQSRNEADLTPLDLQGYASLYKQGGVGQENNLRLRMELAKAALANQAVREHHGTMDIDWSKVANIQDIMKQYGGLGDKGGLSNQQAMDLNKQYSPQGAFKSSPSTPKYNNTDTSGYKTQEGKSPDWYKKGVISKPKDGQKKIVNN